MNKIIHGNCLEELKNLEENSIDSIVTDPPYELGFMGKSWDSTGIANNPLMWAECLRVLKPGGHMLAFSGTRTYHRMAVAIEDAGFEVRDMIEWVYGSGFPKSTNISIRIDKEAGKMEARGVGTSFARKDMDGKILENGKAMPSHKGITEQAKQWEGWGTALKPAHEPICMARKPLSEKTVAQNVLKYGTGGINIDESRVDVADSEKEHFEKEWDREQSMSAEIGGVAMNKGLKAVSLRDNVPTGRFPANLIHDNSQEVRECFPDTKSQGHWSKTKTTGFGEFGNGSSEYLGVGEKDKEGGNASRFFKSIKKDFEYSPKYAILKLCENNISVNNAENNLKTTSQIELVANILSVLKNATPNLDLLNQNLNALFVEKSVKNTSIDFVARCVAIKEIPEELVSQQEYTVFQDYMEDYKKCSQTQNSVSVEKWGNTDITQIMISLLKLCGFVLPVINENTHLVNQEEQQCDYKSLIYKAKASKSERNKGCEGLEEKAKVFNGQSDKPSEDMKDVEKRFTTLPKANNHPTVKPIALMEYLIKMVTPNGGIVLDPFAGSGSTLVAAKQNGYKYIGIEMTEEYIPIIEARLK